MLSPNSVFRPGPDGTVVAMAGRRAFSLSPEVFQLLSLFVREQTLDEAYRALGPGRTREAIGAQAQALERQGLLMRRRGPEPPEGDRDAFPTSLEEALDPAVAAIRPAITEQLAAGRAVVIRNALRQEIAARVFDALDAVERWSPIETLASGPHYQHHTLYAQPLPAAVKECQALFERAESKVFASLLTARDCTGPLEFGATRYLPGDFASLHADNHKARSVAFVWHLSRGWDPSWGGQFIWCQSGVHVPPSFNTLVLFNVSDRTVHAVTPVAPYARAKRLAITGWWSHAGAPLEKQPPRGLNRWGVSSATYGPEPLVVDERVGVLAL